MDGDIIAQMRKEEVELARKLKAVRDFLAAYGATPSNEAKPAPTSKESSASREKVNIDGFSEYGRRIVATAMDAIMWSTHPVKTRQIVEHIEKLGVTISGKEPVNALGALLYRSADIVSHGKAGWTIRDDKAAIEIVSKYAHKENEAPSAEAPEPQKPAGWGVPPPPPASSIPQPWPTAS